MTWVLFDYGGVICDPQPEQDVAMLAQAARCPVASFQAAYWRYRLDYDRAAFDVTTYWQQVGAEVGRSYTDAQIAELSRLDCASWLHVRPEAEALIAALAGAGQRLAVLSNAPADVAVAVRELPVARHFAHLVFSCFLKAVKPDPECYHAMLAVLEATPEQVIFLDDRPDNVSGASELGIRSLPFSTVGDARAGLARYGIAGA